MTKRQILVMLWQRYLPYHVARVRRLAERLGPTGWQVVALEVASADESYRFLHAPEVWAGVRRVCCFPHTSYHCLSAREVRQGVLLALRELEPAVVFAPATAFPEGMAAVVHRLESNGRLFLMDDMWEGADIRHFPTHVAKRLIHRCVDGAFVPAPSHRSYFERLGLPADRIVFGVDAVDNDFFALAADRARARAGELRRQLGLPERYFLFVGRIMPRKGVQDLLAAYAEYRLGKGPECRELVIVGPGDLGDLAPKAFRAPGVLVLGSRFGEQLAQIMGLASALIVPSRRDPWALVANEGAAAGLPLLVSDRTGCAATLVRDGDNGREFRAADPAALARAMESIAALPEEAIGAMGRRSREIVAEWGLDRFVSGAEEALAVARRGEAAVVPRLLSRVWQGTVRVDGPRLARKKVSSKRDGAAREVLVVQRRMVVYRVPMFRQLAERLHERGIRLRVVHGTPLASERERRDGATLEWAERARSGGIDSSGAGLSWLAMGGRRQRSADLVVLPQQARLLTAHTVVARARLRRQRVAFWDHGMNFQMASARGIEARIKNWMARQVDWWFAYTALSVEAVRATGFPAARITCLDNTVDVEELERLRGEIDGAEIKRLRLELGLSGSRLGIFLGGLVAVKRLPFLFSAAEALRARMSDFELLLIGDGPLRAEVERFVATRSWARWVGAQHGRDKVAHLCLGRVMLNPGMVGLGILDSFACGLPLVTTNCGMHSPEIAYLEHARNGMMVENEITAFVDCAEKLLVDGAGCARLAEQGRRDASRYHLAGMVERFAGGIVQALDAPLLDRRRRPS